MSVNDLASAAGLACDIDPTLCSALASQKVSVVVLLLVRGMVLFCISVYCLLACSDAHPISRIAFNTTHNLLLAYKA